MAVLSSYTRLRFVVKDEVLGQVGITLPPEAAAGAKELAEYVASKEGTKGGNKIPGLGVVREGAANAAASAAAAAAAAAASATAAAAGSAASSSSAAAGPPASSPAPPSPKKAQATLASMFAPSAK